MHACVCIYKYRSGNSLPIRKTESLVHTHTHTYINSTCSTHAESNRLRWACLAQKNRSMEVSCEFWNWIWGLPSIQTSCCFVSSSPFCYMTFITYCCLVSTVFASICSITVFWGAGIRCADSANFPSRLGFENEDDSSQSFSKTG